MIYADSKGIEMDCQGLGNTEKRYQFGENQERLLEKE
jgi:hypothetical protein